MRRREAPLSRAADTVPNRHSASAEAASLRWHERESADA